MKIDMETRTVVLPDAPKRIKKITGTRFASILGLNPWSTPFEAWCDMTRTYAVPFEENVYTAAGKAIEPKVIAYLDKRYFFGKGLLKTPEEWFGKTKEQMRYDHFHDEPVFGGMWDARTKNAVWELKTTKRAEDWYRNGELEAPEYYKLQAALYAHLMRLDTFYLVLTILEEGDYGDPGAFIPNTANTLVKKYSLGAEYPEFDKKLDDCLTWYARHITGHLSPTWDEGHRQDKAIVNALTTAHVPQGGQVDIVTELIARIEPLQARIDAAVEDEKALKKLKEQLKGELEGRMGETDKRIQVEGNAYEFEVMRTSSSGVDTERLKKDGLYETYKKSTPTTKFTYRRKTS